MTIDYLDLSELADEVEDPDCSNDDFIYILRLFGELGCVEAEDHPGAWTEDELSTLAADLRAFANREPRLIPDEGFEDFAREMAEDVTRGHEFAWPLCHIDWPAAAESLRSNYTAIEFRGETYWRQL